MINTKINKIAWYLKRPELYSQLVHRLWIKMNSDKEGNQDEVVDTYQQVKIDRKQAIEYLFNVSHVQNIKELFPEIFEKADKTAEGCPVKMGGAADLTLIYHLARLSEAKYVIETGVAYGWSSLALLLAIKDQVNAKLISSDMPYVQRNNEPYVGCVVPEELKDKWKLIRSSDRQALPKALKELPHLDLCHYDSDKSYYGRRWAYPKLWEALKEGGIFISDDIGDNFAFEEFAQSIDRTPMIVSFADKYVGIIRK